MFASKLEKKGIKLIEKLTNATDREERKRIQKKIDEVFAKDIELTKLKKEGLI